VGTCVLRELFSSCFNRVGFLTKCVYVASRAQPAQATDVAEP
jgi:hypothetical protein